MRLEERPEYIDLPLCCITSYSRAIGGTESVSSLGMNDNLRKESINSKVNDEELL